MEVHEMVQALRRQKWFLAVGVLLALVVGFLSVYSPTGKPRAKPQFVSKSRILVDSNGFGLGRVELAKSDTALAGGGFDNRAQTISYFVDSALVQRYVPKPLRDQTVALVTIPFEKVPVFEIQATAATPKAAEGIAQASAEAVGKFFTAREDAAGTPKLQRVTANVIQPATPAVAQSSKAKALGILAVLVLLGLAIFAALTRDKYRQARALREETAAAAPVEGEPEAEPKKRRKGKKGKKDAQDHAVAEGRDEPAA